MPPNQPLVTTVIPTYNRSGLLVESIKSAQRQSFSDIEILVIDNASTDDTKLVVEQMQQHDPRIKYVCNDENIGPTRNFLKGIEMVTTRYFSILSDDDEIKPDFYENAVPILEVDNELMFYAGQTEEVSNGKVIKINPAASKEGKYKPNDGLKFIVNEHIAWTGIVLRTEVTRQIKMFDLNCFFFVENDLEFSIAAKFPFYYRPRIAAVFNFYGYSHHSNMPVIWKSMAAVFAKQSANCRNSPAQLLLLFKWFRKRFPSHCTFVKNGNSVAEKYHNTYKDLEELFSIYDTPTIVRKATYAYVYMFFARQAAYYKLGIAR